MHPVSNSAKISMPVFAQLPSLEDVSYDSKLSDSNDYEIEQDSVRKGFDQRE